MHAHLVWKGKVVSVNDIDVANQQGDGSWIGCKTQTLLWSSMLRPNKPAQGKQSYVQGGAYSLTARNDGIAERARV